MVIIATNFQFGHQNSVCNPGEMPDVVVMPFGSKRGEESGKAACSPFCTNLAPCQYVHGCTYKCRCLSGQCAEVAIIKGKKPSNTADFSLCDVIIHNEL